MERALSDGALEGRIDDFQLADELGRGAMGSVLRAHDRLLGRDVALKVLAAADGGLLRRFVVEAQLGAQLEHPNIVPFYELLATPEGRPAFAMKLIDGETLESYISECSSAAERAQTPPHDLRSRLERFLSICDAVDYAHARGVVHRDLKPGNVMLGAHNEVYVMDWGVARVLEDAPEAPSGELRVMPPSPGLTADGEVIGTPAYMAPEQARGEPVGVAADQFALGMILAELATLRPGRGGSTHRVLLDAMQARPPALVSRWGGSLPRELSAVIRKATAAAPNQRYASVRELAADVRRFVRDEPVSVARDPAWVALWRRLKRRPSLVFAAVAACLLLASAATVVGLSSELRARDLAALHAERLLALTSSVDRTARAVDVRFRRVELLLEGLAAAAEEVTRLPPRGWLEALTPADVAARLNPTHVLRYGQRVSFERSVLVRSPGVAEDEPRPVLERLSSYEALLVGTAARAADGDAVSRLSIARQREAARDRGTISWTDLAFEAGALLVYPANTYFPADFEAKKRSWYTEALAHPGAVWGAPYPDATSGEPIIACSRVMRTEAGELMGVAALHVRLEDVLGALAVAGAPGYQSSALLDAQGYVVLSEATRRVRLGRGTHDNRALERLPFEVAEVRAAIAAGESAGSVQHGASLTVFRRLDSAAWYLAVSVDAEPYGWS